MNKRMTLVAGLLAVTMSNQIMAEDIPYLECKPNEVHVDRYNPPGNFKSVSRTTAICNDAQGKSCDSFRKFRMDKKSMLTISEKMYQFFNSSRRDLLGDQYHDVFSVQIDRVNGTFYMGGNGDSLLSECRVEYSCISLISGVCELKVDSTKF